MAQRRGLKALLLDFDGTLVHLAVDWDALRERLRALFRAHGLDKEFRPIIADIEGALQTLRDRSVGDAELERLRAGAYALIDESEVSAVESSDPVAGAKELLDWARSSDIKTAIITRNCEAAIRQAINKFALRAPDIVIGRSSLNATVKPDPRLVDEALTRLAVPREESLLIGDSAIDLDMGRAAGVKTLLVRSSQTPKDAKALADLRELLLIIGSTGTLSAPKPTPSIPIARPLIGDEEKKAVRRVLDSGQLAQGPAVREFEEAFARWLGIGEAVAVSSGTAALILALQAEGIGPGDEVITSSFSFIAAANAALYLGARPVFADVSEDDFNINPAEIKAKITPRTRAILPVHLYGHPARMTEIMPLAKRHGLRMIEDAAQAHGAETDGRPVGTFGTACFSLYATKNMTTGEGGMITTNDPQIAELLRKLRNQGQTEQRYHHDLLAYNWRMTEIAAAIGLVQLRRLVEFNDRRRGNAQYLSQRLRGGSTPIEREGCRHVYHQYTLRVPRARDALLAHLREQGIGAQVYYPMPIHQQPVYRNLGYEDHLPVSERLSEEVLSLPVHPSLTQDDLQQIVDSVNEFFEGGE